MQREMNNHIAEVVPSQGNFNESPCPMSSKARPRAPPKARKKRKKKPESELSDPEVIIPRTIHLRGRARGGHNNSTKISNERGKLNSSTFVRYFTHIWTSFPKEKLEPVTFFDPSWFELYSHEENRGKILNCIKEKGVFSKKYVFVPIVVWSHWSLLIFCNLGETLVRSKVNAPCMLLLDSLHAIGPTRLEPLIRRLLFDMYTSEKRLETEKQLKKMPLLIPKMKKDWFNVEDIESFSKSLDAFSLAESKPDDSASSDSSDCVQIIEGPSFSGS
ncbi:sentrin/sumo-specific protease [Striga asiatica]|uniref:Sentrin/sumo-specific protease n=1 Tax=Striga asiatica TaxID=4170 RepID=A0A5A7Q619_STRAF|nr:sentrin/sumo-specific protease [Striga asiatica]